MTSDTIQFVQVNPNQRRAFQKSEKDWEGIKNDIVNLFITQHLSLNQLRKALKEQHSFEVTISQLTARLKKWNIRKRAEYQRRNVSKKGVSNKRSQKIQRREITKKNPDALRKPPDNCKFSQSSISKPTSYNQGLPPSLISCPSQSPEVTVGQCGVPTALLFQGLVIAPNPDGRSTLLVINSLAEADTSTRPGSVYSAECATSYNGQSERTRASTGTSGRLSIIWDESFEGKGTVTGTSINDDAVSVYSFKIPFLEVGAEQPQVPTGAVTTKAGSKFVVDGGLADHQDISTPGFGIGSPSVEAPQIQNATSVLYHSGELSVLKPGGADPVLPKYGGAITPPMTALERYLFDPGESVSARLFGVPASDDGMEQLSEQLTSSLVLHENT